MKECVYIICGPTASGKTEAAIELAKLVDGEIISADSMQIYSEISIGTARPSEEEMQGIPHHLMGHIAPDQNYSVALYKEEALKAIDNIAKRGKRPIVAGGTGLYINSITFNLDFSAPKADENLRLELAKRYDEDKEALYAQLIELDPKSEQRIHINNKMRVTRRMEMLLLGEPASEYDFYSQNDRYRFIMAALSPERNILYENINRRVDLMMQKGLEEEARMLYNHYGQNIQAFAAIGYKEFIPYFNAQYSLDEAVEKIKQNTRHFAKRQLTWFKRDERIKWYNPQDYLNSKALAEEILKQ